MSASSDKLRRRFEALTSPRFLSQVEKALYFLGDQTRAEAFHSISAGSVSGKGHKPAPAGQAPHRDTGVLQANIEVVERVEDLTVEVRSNAPYSAPLEFGSSTIAARPFLRPARDKVAAKAGAVAEKFVRKAVRDALRR